MKELVFDELITLKGQRTCYIADPEGNLIEIGSFNKPFER
jgi:extradiol dioxygenase family protein